MRLRPATLMRISITYLYVILEYGYPHSMRDVLAALPKIRKLGFRFLEMEGLGAAHYRKTVIMEPRIGEVICSVDSLLRLIEHVTRPNFQANFDTGHFSAQRENVVLALAKLAGKFANVHVSDNDPVDTNHLPIGNGSIDWLEFFRTLKAMD